VEWFGVECEILERKTFVSLAWKRYLSNSKTEKKKKEYPLAGLPHMAIRP